MILTVLSLTSFAKEIEVLFPELQELCNIRERELAKSYSHTRPDGSNYYTVFGTVNNFNPRGNAENL